MRSGTTPLPSSSSSNRARRAPRLRYVGAARASHRSMDLALPAPSAAPSEGRGAFGGFIGPRTLLANVRVAAPYLFDGSHVRLAELDVLPASSAAPCERAHGPLGWWRLLLDPRGLEALEEPTDSARTDYFALCLAAHHATV